MRRPRPRPGPAELVRRVADWDGLVCLRGQWAGGGALLTSHPLVVLPADADPIAALDDQPAAVGHPDVVGGGWFGRLAFDGPSRLAFHDHVLRHVDGRWRFEALWRPERDAALAGRLAAWRDALAHDPSDAAPARLRAFDVAELLTRPASWPSSLSGAVPIAGVDGVPLPRADELVAGFAAVVIGGGTTVR